YGDSNDGVSDRIDSFELVPNDIPFDDVHGICAGAVDEDSRIGPVVDDIVADGVGMRPDLHFNAVTLSRSRKTVVDPVLLDQGTVHDAGGVIAAHVHAFPRPAIDTRVVDVIAANREVVHVVLKADAHVYVVNDQILEGDVRECALHLDSVSTIPHDFEATEGQPRRLAFDIDRVLERSTRRTGDQRP